MNNPSATEPTPMERIDALQVGLALLRASLRKCRDSVAFRDAGQLEKAQGARVEARQLCRMAKTVRPTKKGVRFLFDIHGQLRAVR